MPFNPDPSGEDRNLPSVAAGAGDGTAPPAPTVSANSNDTRGTISFGSGATPGAGVVVQFTFSRPRDPNRLPVVLLQEANQAAAGIDIAIANITSTGFQLVQNTRLVAASQAAGTYAFSYLVVD